MNMTPARSTLGQFKRSTLGIRGSNHNIVSLITGNPTYIVKQAASPATVVTDAAAFQATFTTVWPVMDSTLLTAHDGFDTRVSLSGGFFVSGGYPNGLWQSTITRSLITFNVAALIGQHFNYSIRLSSASSGITPVEADESGTVPNIYDSAIAAANTLLFVNAVNDTTYGDLVTDPIILSKTLDEIKNGFVNVGGGVMQIDIDIDLDPLIQASLDGFIHIGLIIGKDRAESSIPFNSSPPLHINYVSPLYYVGNVGPVSSKLVVKT